jgi:hypothetical protein
MTQGLLEAVSGAIGEADNEIGGFVLTRLTEAIGPTIALSATYTWNGTTTVTTSDTSEVEIGDWISLDADGQLFQIVNVTFNTSVEIDNPEGYAIPSGTSQSSKARRTLPVESVLDWDEEGRAGIDGVLYRYDSRTDTELQGITHLRGGVLTVGVKKVHNVEAPVMDLNRNRSAIELLRRAMLVAYAEGDDLNAIGRNLGVNRNPFLASDDIFRQIVQAVAYNPKGTVFGLELALDAILGPGNYEIVEDLITDPCTVFIRFLGATLTEEISAGKAFLTGPEYQPPTSNTTIEIDNEVVERGSIGGVRWKDEDLLTDCRTDYPTADLITEYPGDTPHAAWFLVGSGVNLGVDITLTGSAVEFTNPAPAFNMLFRRLLRIVEESEASVSALLTVPTGATIETQINTGLSLDDDTRRCIAGVFADTASTFKVGIINSSWAFVAGGVQLNRDQFYAVTIRKRGNDYWELYIDGALVEEISYTGSWPTSSIHNVCIGHFRVGATSNKLQIKQLSAWTHTTTDYWSGRGTGNVAVGGDQRLVVSTSFFNAGDLGKIVEIKNATILKNNGRFEIETVLSFQIVQLRGVLNSNLQTQYLGSPVRVAVPETGQLFQYPDDIGKKLVISGSTLGNDGTYFIGALLQSGTLQDLSSGATPIPEKTNIAEVTAASFVPETGLNWRLSPSFTLESNVDWEMSDAGSISGTSLTLRQALPISSSQCYRVLEVLYSNVLSAQILLNSLVENEVIQEFPDLWFSYYPFYLSDPLGYVRSYLEALTAAGVIPEFLVV